MSADAFGAGGSDAQQTLQSFWPRVMEEIRNLTMVRFCPPQTGRWGYTLTASLTLYAVCHTHYFQKDFRVQELPLARIKKIMKLDEDVKVRAGSDAFSHFVLV